MQDPTRFVDVVVPLAVPLKYTYRVPADWNEAVAPGKRVLVQFGRNKIYTGLIYSVHEQAPKQYTAKYLESILDEDAVVNALQLQFWDWMAYYYFANPGEVMNAALPAGLKLSSTSRIQINPDFNFEEAEEGSFSTKELMLLDALHSQPSLDLDSLSGLLKVKAPQTIVNKLLKRKALLVYEEVKERYKPKRVKVIRLAEAYQSEDQIKALLQNLEKNAFKQAEVFLRYLQKARTYTTPELKGKIYSKWQLLSEGFAREDGPPLNALIKKGVFESDLLEVDRLKFEKASEHLKTLSEAQNKALLQIRQAFDKKKVTLLQGVTGSGKTELYIHLIQEVLEKGEQVLYLLPEIALTTQLITRLAAVFGERVGIYHSRFSEQERVEIWNKVLKFSSEQFSKGHLQHCQLVLGARSALFLPFQKLGLIVVDEEHDSSFKQNNPAPRYQARDAAIYLASLHKTPVLLGSATPSAETWFHCKENKYELIRLAQQFVTSGGTDLQVCDLNYFQQSNQMKASLSKPLFEGIEMALSKKQQVILFQNRRGFAPYTECKDCAHVPSCIQCDVSLIFHKQQQKLVCHYCGYSIPPPSVCAACGGNHLQLRGLGTEKIEEDVELLFPKARIGRMDLDSTRSKYAYRQIIDDFETGKIDILIGTQMVTKGLDFKNVMVVGILNADSLLHFPDFRSFERAYQLITQVRGRAGRGAERGKVFVQSHHPTHPVLAWVQSGDFEKFMDQTITERKEFFYPPFSRLIELQVIGHDLNEVNHLSQELYKLLLPEFKGKLLGPEFPVVSRIRNRYHKNILLKVSRDEKSLKVRQCLFSAITQLHQEHKNWKYRVSVNVDPN